MSDMATELSARADIVKRIGEMPPDDLVAHLGSLPPDDATALLVALLRARPDEAVRAVDACKVARAWRYNWRDLLGRPTADGVPCAYGDTSPGAEGGPVPEGGTLADVLAAQAAADAALVADGWVLAGGGR